MRKIVCKKKIVQQKKTFQTLFAINYVAVGNKQAIMLRTMSKYLYRKWTCIFISLIEH